MMKNISKDEWAAMSPAEKDQAIVDKRSEIERRKKSSARKRRLLTISWKKISSEKAIKELLVFLRSRKEMNDRVAREGIGLDKDGKEIRLTGEQRVSFLDRNAGLDEVISYIERNMG